MSDDFFYPINSKKARKAVTVEMQRNIWNTHIGTNVKEAPCPLCGINVIQCPTKRCGLELAHIVCEKFFIGEPSPLSLYPSCVSCNNNCGTDNIFDFLFSAGRWKQLENLIRSVHSVFVMMNPNQSDERLMMHNVIDQLYGWERYKSGGGIFNDVEIYNFARMIHMKRLNEELILLTRQMHQKTEEMQLVSQNIPKRKRPPTVI